MTIMSLPTFLLCQLCRKNHPMCVFGRAGWCWVCRSFLRDIPQYNDTFKGDAVMAKTDDEFLELISKLRKDKKAYKKAQLGAEKIAERFDSSAGAERLVEFYRSLI